MKSAIVIIAAALLAFSSGAGEGSSMQTEQRFETKVTKSISMKYLLFLPNGYDVHGTRKWPVILFLHGSGERGNDLQKVAVHGPPKIVKTKPDLPFIIVSPQCPDNQSWDNDALMALLDEVTARNAVDTKRIYLTGLSLGGFGTWSLASAHPERFAAIAPICGGGQPVDIIVAGPEKKKALCNMGVWAFHGGKDPVVNVNESERMVAAFKEAGCTDIKLTVYPEAGHDSWTETYNNPELYDWFLKHSR